MPTFHRRGNRGAKVGLKLEPLSPKAFICSFFQTLASTVLLYKAGGWQVRGEVRGEYVPMSQMFALVTSSENIC